MVPSDEMIEHNLIHAVNVEEERVEYGEEGGGVLGMPLTESMSDILEEAQEKSHKKLHAVNASPSSHNKRKKKSAGNRNISNNSGSMGNKQIKGKNVPLLGNLNETPSESFRDSMRPIPQDLGNTKSSFFCCC
jgi:hypothetical protein